MSIYHNGGTPTIKSGGTTYTLTEFADPEYNFNEHDFKLHTSVITGKRTLVSKGKYCTAKLSMYGLSYSLADTLRGLIGTKVTFYPYGTGNITVGTDAYQPLQISMLVVQAKFYHKDSLLWKDACNIEMVSEEYATNALTLIPT
jgi:hypothetical protein